MKGDANRYQTTVDTERQRAQSGIDRLGSQIGDRDTQFGSQYQQGLGQSQGDYNNLMNQYNRIMFGGVRDASGRTSQPGIQDLNLNPADRANVERSIAGYSDFANTGGFTPQGIQDIRARSIAPTRAVFQRGMDEVARNRALSGSNTGSNAALAKMARESGQAISDANVNANAGIAQMIQQGRLAGLGGLSSTGQGLMNSQFGADQARNALMLGGMQGQRDLFGTTPGMSSMLGNFMLANQGQGIDLQRLQNQLGLGTMDAQFNRSRIPSNFQQALGNVGGTLDVAGRIGRGIGGIFG